MLVFLLLPVVTWERGHIVIDLLDGLTPGWLHAPQSLLIDLAGAAACAVAARALARQAALAYDYGDTIAYLDWPRGAIVGAMAGLMALTALAFAANALRSLRAAVRGRA
ncbi:MAG: Tripartite ATP-independent transporter, DctQ component [Rhodobacteraceae bacterium HLUCCA24]|nr:MAG: Tripartite ATP-independent transporter, DctQ component [Rhodobacteraceae bacterium HLUCCA24]